MSLITPTNASRRARGAGRCLLVERLRTQTKQRKRLHNVPYCNFRGFQIFTDHAHCQSLHAQRLYTSAVFPFLWAIASRLKNMLYFAETHEHN